MTLYIREFGDNSQEDEDFQKHIDLMDGIVMWNWCESDYEAYDVACNWLDEHGDEVI